MKAARIAMLAVAAAAATLHAPPPASAVDLLKITVGQRGNWDTSIAHLGDKAGIFKKHNIELEIVYTSGSGETLQPVIAGSADMGFAVGTQGAMSAFAKGAPVRIVGAEATGAADYWYAKATSPIKTLQDTNGRTIAFSTQGSSTQSIVRAFIDELKLTAKPVATGNPSATLTAVMTDQVDVGWASPPFGLKEQEAGQIRVVAKASDAALVRGQTIRVIVANAQALEKKKGRDRPVHGRLPRNHRLHVFRQSAGDQGLCGIREGAGADGPTRARRILSQDTGESRRGQGTRHAGEGGGQPQIHQRTPDAEATRRARSDSATQVGWV